MSISAIDADASIPYEENDLNTEKYSCSYANRFQKAFAYASYKSNFCYRHLVCSIDYLLRDIPKTTQDKAYHIAKCVILFIPTLAGFGLSSFFYLGAYGAQYVNGGRFEYIEHLESPALTPERVTVLSLNACLQDPYSPLTGGVSTPMESLGGFESRVAGIVKFISDRQPHVFVGQEFESPDSQNKFIELMKKDGYHYFLQDLGTDCLLGHSGLFVASTLPIKNIQFASFLMKDRVEIAKFTHKGAIAFSVETTKGALTIANMHLNSGESQNAHGAKIGQLKKYVMPMIESRKEPFVLLGDSNLDTSKINKSDAGLDGLINQAEGLVTCSDQGKHELRGKSKIQNGQPCTDCEEKIDVVIYDPNKIKATNLEVEPVILNGARFSDHYAVKTTVETI